MTRQCRDPRCFQATELYQDRTGDPSPSTIDSHPSTFFVHALVNNYFLEFIITIYLLEPGPVLVNTYSQMQLIYQARSYIGTLQLQDDQLISFQRWALLYMKDKLIGPVR
jgi:hypothetical protein